MCAGKKKNWEALLSIKLSRRIQDEQYLINTCFGEKGMDALKKSKIGEEVVNEGLKAEIYKSFK